MKLTNGLAIIASPEAEITVEDGEGEAGPQGCVGEGKRNLAEEIIPGRDLEVKKFKKKSKSTSLIK